MFFGRYLKPGHDCTRALVHSRWLNNVFTCVGYGLKFSGLKTSEKSPYIYNIDK